MSFHRLPMLVLGGILLHCPAGWADEPLPDQHGVIQTLGISGSVRGGYWSSSMNLDGKSDQFSEALWIKSEPRLGKNASLLLEGWLMNEDATRGDGRRGKLREGYLNMGAGNADFRIGKQIIVWGRADKFNPTDNLSPRDYTLLAPEDDDQRSGVYAAKATYNLKDWSLSGFWLPEFRPNVLPLPHTPGLSFRERIPHGQGGGIKVEQSGKAVDWSASYYDGLDLNPDLSIGSFSSSGLNLRLDHHRVRVIGVDAATVVWRYGLRAEAAYTRTEDSDGRDPFVKNPFFYLVAGGDRTFFEYLNINLQYYVRYVSRYQNPASVANPALRTVAIQGAVISNQFDRFQHGMTFRISDKWLHETLEGEVAGIASFTRRDFALKPKLVYSFNDHWKSTFGANLFRGEDNTFYGRLRDDSTVFMEIRYSF
ncbi:MAG TPA: DUF1302 family protein [Novimethylophilus sp.]|jgi:hypothetical protein|uniref:DUF1302 family protein n=1 Tax=Novimethylophilus sp. TaxID=2137426 RepID=UPI002F4081DC